MIEVDSYKIDSDYVILSFPCIQLNYNKFNKEIVLKNSALTYLTLTNYSLNLKLKDN